MLTNLTKLYSLTLLKYAVLINGMGATPLMEQYIFSNDVFNV